MYKSHSPLSNTVLQRYVSLKDDELTAITRRATETYHVHRKASWSDHAEKFGVLASLLMKYQEELSALMTLEMGKRIIEAQAEIDKCAHLCTFYAQNIHEFLAPIRPEVQGAEASVHFKPLGVILMVMPWNFPFWQVFRCAIPTIGAGNTVLLKHASSVPQCAAAIENLFIEAGFDRGVFQNIYAKKKQVARMIGDPAIQGVSLTGSTIAGKKIYQLAAKYIKPVVLELGGSDPYIILEDADVEAAARICAEGRMLNCGQSCIGAKRFIVVKKVYSRFLKAFRKQMESYKFGDPYKAATRLGPLSSFQQRDTVHEQVLRSIAEGAHLLIGGFLPLEIEGAFYPPTILTEVQPGQTAYTEEIFGPVASVLLAKDESEAINIANDSEFGLGAAIFSNNVRRAEEIATEEIEAGNVFINAHVLSHPNLPFGGIKSSGVGRELWIEGIRAFTNIKTIYKRK